MNSFFQQVSLAYLIILYHYFLFTFYFLIICWCYQQWFYIICPTTIKDSVCRQRIDRRGTHMKPPVGQWFQFTVAFHILLVARLNLHTICCMYCIYAIIPKYYRKLSQNFYRYLLFQHTFLINPICGFIKLFFDRFICIETLMNYINYSITISFTFV